MARLLVTQIRADVNTPWWHETEEGKYWYTQIQPIWQKYGVTTGAKMTDDKLMHVSQVFYNTVEDYENSKAECLAQFPGYLDFRASYCLNNRITIGETFIPLPFNPPN